MNLVAHILLSIILTHAVLEKTPPLPANVLLNPAYLVAMIGSTVPDIDHIPLLKRALNTKRFGVGTRSKFHELYGYLIFSTLIYFMYITLSPTIMLALYIGLTSHYLLDALTRPTRPLYPYTDVVVNYGLAPNRELKHLVIFDIGVTGLLLSIYIYLIGYYTLFVALLVLSITLIASTIKALKREELRTSKIKQAFEPERTQLAMIGKYVTRKLFRSPARFFSKIHPDRLSGLSLLFSILIPILISYSNLALATLVLLIILLLDLLDGLVSKMRGLAGIEGWVVDIGTDRWSEAIISLVYPVVLIPLTLLNTFLSIYSFRTKRHIILPVRQLLLVVLVFLVITQAELKIYY